MAYFKVYCDALCQYCRYTMIYCFVIFDVINQVIATKKDRNKISIVLQYYEVFSLPG